MNNTQEQQQSQSIIPNPQEQSSYPNNNITSQQSLPQQQQPQQQQQSASQNINDHSQLSIPIISNNNNTTRQSSRIKYQRMKTANQQYQNFFKQYLQKALECPITHEPMSDPVIASSGKTFQRMDLLDWIRSKGKTCPYTRMPITDALVTNLAIKNLSQQYDAMLKSIKDQQTLLKRQRRRDKNNRIPIIQYQRQYAYLILDKNKHLLDHSFKLLHMPKFICVDWKFFQQMNLCHCGITNEGIQMLLQKGRQQFKNVMGLNIQSNKITVIRDIGRLGRLKRLYVGGNQFVQETMEYLKRVGENQEVVGGDVRRRVVVKFDVQPL